MSMKPINTQAQARMSKALGNYINAAAVLDQLLKDGPAHVNVGICGNFRRMRGKLLPYSDRAFKAWSKFSGDASFPVPVRGYATTWQGYNASRHVLWVGEQAGLRLDLLLHLRQYYLRKAARIADALGVAWE